MPARYLDLRPPDARLPPRPDVRHLAAPVVGEPAALTQQFPGRGRAIQRLRESPIGCASGLLPTRTGRISKEPAGRLESYRSELHGMLEVKNLRKSFGGL